MCTVTFYPKEEGFILTSNRDEVNRRPTIPLDEYQLLNDTVFYPKDKQAGGTWIATNKSNKVACLLNGGFEKHQRNLPYNKSRGKVVLEYFEFNGAEAFVHGVDLAEVEPFTLVLLENRSSWSLTELVWDGSRKHVQSLSIAKPYIWSSSTLYAKEVRDKRANWFKDMIDNKEKLNSLDLMNFHQSKYSENQADNVLMKRGDGLETVSVSQIISSKEKMSFTYHDLLKNRKIEK